MIRIRAIVPMALFSLIGCGSEEDRIALVPVTGTVTQNNKPLAGATITFVPDPSNKFSTPGADSTGPEGNYKVRFRNRAGVAPGKYKVFVIPADPAPPAAHTAFANDPMMAKIGAEAARVPTSKSEAAGVKSEFEAVVSETDHVVDIDVKSTPTTK